MINRQNGNFTIILNEIVDNEKLSAKAKGIYLYLQSKADGWQFYESEIVKNFTDGKDGIRSGIKELMDAKLLLKYQERKSGKFDSTLWILNPTVDDYKLYDNTVDGKPADGKSDDGKPADGKSDDGKPVDGKPATNKTNNKKTNNNNTNKSKNIQKSDNHVYFIERKNNDLFYEYLALRKKMKLSNSETVIKRLIGKVREYYKKGHSIEVIITNAIIGGWKDFYEPKDATTTPTSFKEQDRQRTNEVADAVLNKGFDPFDPANYQQQPDIIDAQIEGGENV